MPTYVYKCIPNGHQFEVFQRMSDAPVTECDVCGGEVTRLLFAPAIHFKGSGFHNTDYGTRRRPVGADGDGGGDGGTNGGPGDGAGKTGDGAAKTGGGDSAGTASAASSSSSANGGGGGGKTVGLDTV